MELFVFLPPPPQPPTFCTRALAPKLRSGARRDEGEAAGAGREKLHENKKSFNSARARGARIGARPGRSLKPLRELRKVPGPQPGTDKASDVSNHNWWK